MFNVLANAVEKVDVEFIDTLIKRGYILGRNESNTRSISVRDAYMTPYLVEQLSYFRDILSILSVIITHIDNAKQVYTDLDFHEPKKHLTFLRQVYYSSKFSCKNLLRKCYYPYEDEIKDFFKNNNIVLNRTSDASSLGVFLSTAPNTPLKFAVRAGYMSSVAANGSYIPELTIEQVSQPRHVKEKKGELITEEICYFPIYHSHVKLILTGSRHILSTNLYIKNSNLIIEEDYSDGHVYSNASVTNALLDNMLFMSQYPNGKSTIGFSKGKRGIQPSSPRDNNLVCKAGLVVLHVLDKVYQQKASLIEYTLKNSSSDFLPICVKPVTESDLKEDLKEVKNTMVLGPSCILPNVGVLVRSSKVTGLDKNLGTSITLENDIRIDNIDYQFESYWEKPCQVQLDNYPVISKRYDILQQELSRILDETEYSLYLLSSLKLWFNYADGKPIAEGCVDRPPYIDLEKDVKLFAEHMSFSYSAEF